MVASEEAYLLTRACGILVLLFFAIHNSTHVVAGRPGDILWTCNLAPLLVGIGLLAGWPRVASVGLLWLTLGVPLWLLDLATGGTLAPTSILTHMGGLAGGLFAAGRLGIPRGAWLVALSGLLLLHIASRLATPPALNVNLAHAIWAGWENRFSSYTLYQLLVIGVAAITFFLGEHVYRRTLAPNSRD